MLVVPEEAGGIDAPLQRQAAPELRRPEIREVPIHSPILWRFRPPAEAATLPGRVARRSGRRAKIAVIAGSPVHAALLRDVRLLVHRLPLRVPVAADRAVSDPGARRRHVGGGTVSRLPH